MPDTTKVWVRTDDDAVLGSPGTVTRIFLTGPPGKDGGGGVPTGGSAGQYLRKNSATDQDAGWAALTVDVAQPPTVTTVPYADMSPVIVPVDGGVAIPMDEGGYLAHDGIFYMIGGYVTQNQPDSLNQAVPFIQRFDLEAKQFLSPVLIPLPPWFDGDPSAPGLSFEGGAYGVINNKLYFGGGDGNFGAAGQDGNGNGNWIASYDPATQTFDWTLPSSPRGWDYSFWAVADGKLWVGPRGTPAQTNPPNYDQQVMSVFDPGTATWSQVDWIPPGFNPRMPPGTIWNPAEFYYLNDMCIGVQVGRRIIWPDAGIDYDIDTQVFTPCADPVTTPPVEVGYTFPSTILDSGVAVAPDDRLWVVGIGRDPSDPNGWQSTKIGTRIFDPTDNTWHDPAPGDGIFALNRDDAFYAPLPAMPDGYVAEGDYWGLTFDAEGVPVLLGGNTGAASRVPAITLQEPVDYDTKSYRDLGFMKLRQSEFTPDRPAQYTEDGVYVRDIGFTFRDRGIWVSVDTEYQQGDLVQYVGSRYIAIKHISAQENNNSIPLDTSRWALVSNAGGALPANFGPGSAYGSAKGGDSTSQATGFFAWAYGGGGSGAVASGDYSDATGRNTVASGESSHVEGSQTLASGNKSHCEGYGVTASGEVAHAEGRDGDASGGAAHKEGDSGVASGYASHAEGGHTVASLDYAHAEGFSTTASGLNSHAEGYLSTASGNHSHAQGVGARAFRPGEDAIGGGQWPGGESIQSSRVIMHVATANASPTEMLLPDGVTEGMSVPVGGTTALTGLVVARSSDGSVVSSWRIDMVMDLTASSSDRIIGSSVAVLHADAGAASWAVTLQYGGSFHIVVTGQAATSIRWVATLDMTEVRFL